MTGIEERIDVSIKLSRQLGVYVAQAKCEPGILPTDELMPIRLSTFIAAAFVKHAACVENAFGIRDLETLRIDARDFNCSYVVQPVILNLKGRDFNSVAIDRVRTDILQLSIRLDIHRSENGERLGSPNLHVLGYLDEAGNQYPCDLLADPLERLATSLYN